MPLPRCNQYSQHHIWTKRRYKDKHSLQPDTALITFQHQQVSHLTSHNTASSIETNLFTDTVLDGHTAFHTTLQVVTRQGCKNLQVKVDPGAAPV